MPATTEKKCGRCREVYRGFGSTCGTCRKLPFDGLAAVNASAAGPADRNNCGVCGKRVYAMEHMSVEGVTFHKDCFRCTTCRRKLGTVFEKSGMGFFCPAHFKQITTITGGYMLGSDPSRNAKTTNLLEKLVGRSGPEDDESFDCSEDVETEVDKKVNEAEPSDCEHASATDFYPVLSKAGVLDEPNGTTKESDAIKVSENTDSFIKYYTRHFLPSPVVQWTPPQTVA
jgi:hypothetical protein|mmetsp:Transcript_13390/g.26292  ORF Transcript_13390/g.26292 Transcript_13390/m.26292 type:complete len:228 (-) Transcript_13390:358-1041(-)